MGDYRWVFEKTLEWDKDRPGSYIAWIGPWGLQEHENWDILLREADEFFLAIPGVESLTTPWAVVVTLPSTGTEIHVMRNSCNLSAAQSRRFDYYVAWEEEMAAKESADILGTILGRARGGIVVR